MDPRLKMLLWKEWRERRDQLFLCLGLAGACALCAAIWTFGRMLRGDRPDRFPWEVIAWFYSLVMPLFIAMRTACGEETDRTTTFSLALPVAPLRAAWIRLSGGAMVLLAPFVLIVALASTGLAIASLFDFKMARQLAGLMPVGWSRLPMFWLNAALIAVATLGCYLQLAVLGTFVRSENRLALLGAALTIVSIIAGLASGIDSARGNWVEVVSPQTAALSASIMANAEADQFGQYAPRYNAARIGWPLFGNLIEIGLLAVWFTFRYGARLASAGQPVRGNLVHRALQRLLPAWRCWPLQRVGATQWGAIAWLALRQSLPMCLVGLVIALFATLLIHFPFGRDAHPRHDLRALAGFFALFTLVIGVLWASVVGVGSAADELDARCGDFWRTRPIPFWRLFTIKFLVGLVVVVAVLDGPVMVLLTSEAFKDVNEQGLAFVACCLPLHAMMFAMALAWACLLRRVAVGAIAAVATVGALALAGVAFPALQQFNPLVIYEQLLRDAHQHENVINLMSNGYPLMATVLVLAIVVSFVVAGCALAVYQPRRQLS
jgi:hypothetical protein